MLETLLDFAAATDAVLWGPWTVAFIAAVSVYLTARSGFFQIRRVGLIAAETIGGALGGGRSSAEGRMSPFQATTTALAGTVGMGNMAGVATALSIGGPGAIFWMWVLAAVGMMTKTAEITLAVHYRDVDDRGRFHGGPMFYITKGLGLPDLAVLFSVGVIINSLLSASLLQSHTVGRAFLTCYGWDPYLVTAAMAVVTLAVVIGGVRRIGRFCETLVPLMSLVYVTCGAVVVLANYERIPHVFGLITSCALAPTPALGGFAGAAIAEALQQGMARGMLSNEAGLGTAPMAHATADTTHPFKQGMWGAFEVFVDTIVICTITSFAILSTGALESGMSGIDLVIRAFEGVFPPQVAGSLVSFCILTFCLTTQIGFFIYFETAMIHAFGNAAFAWMKYIYFLPGIVFAGVAEVDKLWSFANISVFACAAPNLIAVVALSGAFFRLMRDYLSGRNEFATAGVDAGKNYVRLARGNRGP